MRGILLSALLLPAALPPAHGFCAPGSLRARARLRPQATAAAAAEEDEMPSVWRTLEEVGVTEYRLLDDCAINDRLSGRVVSIFPGKGGDKAWVEVGVYRRVGAGALAYASAALRGELAKAEAKAREAAAEQEAAADGAEGGVGGFAAFSSGAAERAQARRPIPRVYFTEDGAAVTPVHAMLRLDREKRHPKANARLIGQLAPGKRVDCYATEVQADNGRLIASLNPFTNATAAVEAAVAAGSLTALEGIAEGAVLAGEVCGARHFGVFVDVGAAVLQRGANDRFRRRTMKKVRSEARRRGRAAAGHPGPAAWRALPGLVPAAELEAYNALAEGRFRGGDGSAVAMMPPGAAETGFSWSLVSAADEQEEAEAAPAGPEELALSRGLKVWVRVKRRCLRSKRLTLELLGPRSEEEAAPPAPLLSADLAAAAAAARQRHARARRAKQRRRSRWARFAAGAEAAEAGAAPRVLRGRIVRGVARGVLVDLGASPFALLPVAEMERAEAELGRPWGEERSWDPLALAEQNERRLRSLRAAPEGTVFCTVAEVERERRLMSLALSLAPPGAAEAAGPAAGQEGAAEGLADGEDFGDGEDFDDEEDYDDEEDGDYYYDDDDDDDDDDDVMSLLNRKKGDDFGEEKDWGAELGLDRW